MSQLLRVERVEVTLRKADGVVFDRDALQVEAVWSGGVDRPNVGGYILDDDAKGRKLAARLQAAMLAQAVYYDAEVAVDVNGRTYVQASTRVLGRKMNADLRRLGY